MELAAREGAEAKPRRRAPLAPVPPLPGRGRRNLPAAEWQARILQAARYLITDLGYEATTMAEIARVAGLSRARLYRLYDNRHEVLEALLADDANRLAGEIVLAVARAQSLQEKVRAMVTVFFNVAERTGQRNRLLYSQGEDSEIELGNLLRCVRGALAETLGQYLATSTASTTDPESRRLACHAVIAMAEGAAVAWMGGPRMDLERAVSTVTGVALDALELRRPSSS
ncbi:MAG: TetR/AcrR family transcriptional regulator [Candidatus Dormibacteria bacterium]